MKSLLPDYKTKNNLLENIRKTIIEMVKPTTMIGKTNDTFSLKIILAMNHIKNLLSI